MTGSANWPNVFNNRLRRFCAGVLLLSGLGLGLMPAAAQADTVEIVVSPEHAAVAVDRPMLRALFTMRTREWPDGQPARVFVLPDSSDVHDAFCRELLGIYPYVLRNAWDRMVFTGTGFAPEVVRSESEMRQKVRATPGAIGYVRKASSASFSVQPKEVKNER